MSKLEAVEALRVFKAVAETESRKHEVLTDSACKLSMGKMCWICKESSIMLNTTVLYHPALNSMADHTTS